ncbi:hypothetical protein ACFLZB_02300 [Nanoarchaeota archaeon]
MSEKKTIAYKDDLGLVRPTVKVMYAAYTFLEDLGVNPLVQDVRVCGSTPFHIESRLFSHITQLEKHYKNGKTNYIIRDQEEIDQIIAFKSKQTIMTRGLGVFEVADPFVHLIDKKDKDGSYLTFEDEEDLVEGNISYVRERTVGQIVRGALELTVGNYFGLNVGAFGSALGNPIIMLAGGLGVGYFTFNGLNRILFGNNQIHIDIFPKHDSPEAHEKIDGLMEKLKEGPKNP